MADDWTAPIMSSIGMGISLGIASKAINLMPKPPRRRYQRRRRRRR